MVYSISQSILIILALAACSPKTVQRGILRETEYKPAPPVVEKRSNAQVIDAGSIEQIRADNKKARFPSFAFIRGFYQLPQAFSETKLRHMQGVSVFGSFSVTQVESTPQAKGAISPIPASHLQSQAFEQAITVLLDAGVVIKEISMADAVKVMEKEQQAVKKKELFIPGTSLPPGVDAFISLQRGVSDDRGNILAGRVITSDGRLLAFATEIDDGFGHMIRPLIIRLVSQALSRWPTK